METRTERRTGVGLSRRTLLAGTAAAAGASAISWKVIAEQIETLSRKRAESAWATGGEGGRSPWADSGENQKNDEKIRKSGGKNSHFQH